MLSISSANVYPWPYDQLDETLLWKLCLKRGKEGGNLVMWLLVYVR